MCRLELSLVGRRRGFTLVEMLVVLSLMLILAALAIAFVPRMNERAKTPRGASQLQMWLLIARQWAKRDNVPTGIRLQSGRLYPSPANFNPDYRHDLQYIQQPNFYHANDPVNGFESQIASYETVPPGTPPPTGGSANNCVKGQMNSAAGLVPLDFYGGNGPSVQYNWAVQPGDYLETPTSGNIYRILAVTFDPNNVPVNPNVGDVLVLSQPVNLTSAKSDYRIIRGPRILPGEQALQLPQDVAIDISTNQTFGNNLPRNSSTQDIDILFAPSGQVITPGFSTDKIILWVRDVSQDLNVALPGVGTGPGASGLPAGDQSLIVVYTRTGFIAAHNVFSGKTMHAQTPVTQAMLGTNVQITVDDASGINADDYLIIDTNSPANSALGIFQETQQVFQVQGNTITFKQMMFKHQQSQYPVLSDPYSYVRSAKSSGM